MNCCRTKTEAADASASRRRNIAETIFKDALRGLELWENQGIGIDDFLDTGLDEHAQRRAVSSVLFNYFRYKSLIDQEIRAHVKRGVKPALRRLLAATLTQCFFQTGIAAESAVNVAVDMARRRHGNTAAGFVNAVMRNAGRGDFPQRCAAVVESSPVKLLPEIIRRRWKRQFSTEEAERLSRLLLSQAPLSFRDCGQPLSDAELEELAAVRVSLPWLKQSRFYECEDAQSLFSGALLESGRIYIQDPSSALFAELAELSPDERILDLCAAPGGKSLLMAEKLGTAGTLTAADRSERRQQLTRENFQARNLSHRIIVGNAAELPLEPASYTLVLADAPCSNTGVFRRRPDALWRFSEKRLVALAEAQRAILEAAARFTASGGRLIYSVCSIEPEEGHDQVEQLIRRMPGFSLQAEKLLLPELRHDGGYVAVLLKQPD